MLALSPPLFSTSGWLLEDPISHGNYNRSTEAETSDSFLQSPLSRPQVGPFDATNVKKINHNASERDRRKRVNILYSSLFSLLPAADQTKKLSIPATVSRVVKYIPDLQKEVERLVQKKEELSSRIPWQEDLAHAKKRRKGTVRSSSSTVSATPLGDREVVLQIFTAEANNSQLCEALQILEEDGFCLLNASSFQSSGERVFYSLHLQVFIITSIHLII
ncbi:hypothetical protein RJ640_007309 [Escallonia rubra]|uniref:BHLH domain-containing protein n=1 Tax=Escallonia rubra TaxID=112253 RepID=A0AA88RXS6_9ASTE|nr:hypothetical protein RJ640_007309 [Escallonia rubra]